MIVDEDIYLEHYGKKGMRWGERRAAASSNRARNKESRKSDRDKHRNKVDKAAEKINSGRSQREYKKAKSQHAQNKANLGSREARKILNTARAKRDADWNTAMQARDGKEAAQIILGTTAVAIGVASLMALADSKFF